MVGLDCACVCCPLQTVLLEGHQQLCPLGSVLKAEERARDGRPRSSLCCGTFSPFPTLWGVPGSPTCCTLPWSAWWPLLSAVSSSRLTSLERPPSKLQSPSSGSPPVLGTPQLVLSPSLAVFAMLSDSQFVKSSRIPLGSLVLLQGLESGKDSAQLFS